ncbi:MAG: hypothetical protein HOV70_19905 [Streptomyces sp.]|nr:hypothetical protein [Streptomyces sp.]
MTLKTIGPEQIPSRTCGCADCIIDYPPEQYGHRPPQSACQGLWQVRWRGADRRLRSKNLGSRGEAHLFLVQLQAKAGGHAA